MSGPQWNLAGVIWPDEREPDWEAIERAACDLDSETVEFLGDMADPYGETLRNQAIDSINAGWGDDEDDEDDEYERFDRCLADLVAGRLLDGLAAVREALADGSHEITVVNSGGSTILLTGGLDGLDSDDPLEALSTLSYAGLIGGPFADWWGGPVSGGQARVLPRRSGRLVDAIKPISTQSRLVVAELPHEPDWGRALARAVDSGDEELIRFVAAGDIGPFSIYRRPLEHATLWIGDQNEFLTDPPVLRPEDIAPGARMTGGSGILMSLMLTGALHAVGGAVLTDIRLRTDSAQLS